MSNQITFATLQSMVRQLQTVLVSMARDPERFSDYQRRCITLAIEDLGNAILRLDGAMK